MMWVSVCKLSEIYDPFEDPPWDEVDIGSISVEMIEARIKLGGLKKVTDYDPLIGCSIKDHIDSIAWYVVNGWGDSFITIDFNLWNALCGIGCLVTDGNHRYAAALIRGDQMIWADVYGSKEDIARLYDEDESLTNIQT
jgi:hypothetical protein